MRWLLWKDFRVNRAIFITILLVFAVLHALAAISFWRKKTFGPADRAVWLAAAACYGIMLSQLMFAFVGGNALAGERTDRSAEFMAYLPIARGRILVSKLLVALGAALLVWMPNLVTLVLVALCNMPKTMPPLGEFVRHALSTPEFWLPVAITAVTGLTFFCAAWLFSCLLSSASFSALGGLVTPGAVLAGLLWVDQLGKWHHGPHAVAVWYVGLCLAVSAVSFAAGTIYYLRRVEP